MEPEKICPICTDAYKTPITIACNHTFCFLCIKQTALFGNYKCPICRADIPNDILTNAVTSIENMNDEVLEYAWVYGSGASQWWFYQYDHNLIIETAWKVFKDDMCAHYSTVTIEICSADYIVDFVNMIQKNSRTNKVRKIARVENVTLKDGKGVAGLRYVQPDKIVKNVTYNNSTNTSNFNPHYASSYLEDSPPESDESDHISENSEESYVDRIDIIEDEESESTE